MNELPRFQFDTTLPALRVVFILIATRVLEVTYNAWKEKRNTLAFHLRTSSNTSSSYGT